MQRIEEGNLDFELSLLFRICEALEIKPFFLPFEEEFTQKEIKQALFEDAHSMSILHSKTFEAPTNEQLSKLKAGSLVKVNCLGERFWCKISFVDFDNKLVIASIDNELVKSDEHNLFVDDYVKFGFQNIYSIYED